MNARPPRVLRGSTAVHWPRPRPNLLPGPRVGDTIALTPAGALAYTVYDLPAGEPGLVTAAPLVNAQHPMWTVRIGGTVLPYTAEEITVTQTAAAPVQPPVSAPPSTTHPCGGVA